MKSEPRIRYLLFGIAVAGCIVIGSALLFLRPGKNVEPVTNDGPGTPESGAVTLVAPDDPAGRIHRPDPDSGPSSADEDGDDGDFDFPLVDETDPEESSEPGPLIGITWEGLNPPREARRPLEILAGERLGSGRELPPAHRAAYAWTGARPGEAWRWAQRLPGELRNEILFLVGELWARKDPEAALAAAEALGDEAEAASLANRILLHWAETDPAAASRAAIERSGEDAEGRRRATDLLPGAILADPGATAGDLVRLLDEGMARAGRLREKAERARAGVDRSGILEERADALEAEAIAEENLVEDQIAAFAEIGGEMARRNLGDALGWLEGIQHPDARGRAAAGILPQWLREDPAAATLWIESQESTEARDPAIRALVDFASAEDPAIALRWAGQIADAGERSDLLVQEGTRWLAVSPDDAGPFLKKTDLLNEEERERIFEGAGEGEETR